MSVQEQYLGPVTGYYEQIRGTRWKSQSFTPISPHNIAKVKLWIDKGSSYGLTSVTVEIYLADVVTHKPTGSILTSGSVLAENIQPACYGDENHPTTIILDSVYALLAGIEYCIVVYSNPGSYYTYLFGGDGGYEGGHRFDSYDSGSNWDSMDPQDLLFMEYDDTSNPPDVPSGLDCPENDIFGEFDVSWNAVEGSDYYELRQRKSPDDWVLIYSGADLVCPVRKLVSGSYTYQVRACSEENGNSDWSIEKICTVDRPVFTPSESDTWLLKKNEISGGV